MQALLCLNPAVGQYWYYWDYLFTHPMVDEGIFTDFFDIFLKILLSGTVEMSVFAIFLNFSLTRQINTEHAVAFKSANTTQRSEME